MNEEQRPYHEAANIFPLMQGDEYEALRADIDEYGQRETIHVDDDGAIIDGRNRHRACLDLGLAPQIETWRGEGSIVAYVISANLHRRHLNSGQRAAISLEAEALYAIEAKERQGTRNDLNIVETFPQSNGKARDRAAADFGTNPRYVSDAKKLHDEAPDLFEAVKAGEMTLPAATRASRPHVSNNSGNNEWYTPPEYIKAARAVMGEIDLDPASSAEANEVVGAGVFYTSEDDGLSRDWAGRVWMNPPYAAGLVDRFASKLVNHYSDEMITEAIVLVNNATETTWFRALVSLASAVVFPGSRVKYWSPGGVVGAPLQGQAVVYLGERPGVFLAQFKHFGWGCHVSI